MVEPLLFNRGSEVVILVLGCPVVVAVLLQNFGIQVSLLVSTVLELVFYVYHFANRTVHRIVVRCVYSGAKYYKCGKAFVIRDAMEKWPSRWILECVYIFL